HTTFSLFLFSKRYDGLKVFLKFSLRITLRCDINVMETVEGCSQFGHKFKCSIQFVLSGIQRIVVQIPWENFSAGTERVTTCATESMPVGCCKAQMLSHSFARHYAVGVVIFKCQIIIR